MLVSMLSCLAEQAKILVAEAKDNNLDHEARDERWARWHVCGLCGHQYHGVVKRALGWACWKTYVGRSFLFFRNIRLGLWAPWLLAFAVAFAAWTWLSPT